MRLLQKGPTSGQQSQLGTSRTATSRTVGGIEPLISPRADSTYRQMVLAGIDIPELLITSRDSCA